MTTDLLFHHDVIVAPLASGSRGNCTYVGDDRSGVLIDCGLSARQVLRRLEALGLGDVRIDAVLVTHEHSDHVGAAQVLEQCLAQRQGAGVPFYGTRGTLFSVDRRCAPSRIEPVTAGHPFTLGPLLIEPVPIPHDTADPVAYLVTHRDVTVGVLTDLGKPTRAVARMVGRMDIAVVEFNHDLTMLLEGRYPWRLKQRVRGGRGHLSNDQAAQLLVDGASGRLRHLVLAHLSEQNNRPELAREVAEAALHRAGLNSPGRRRVEVTVAMQHTPTGPVRATATAPVATPSRPARPARPAVPGARSRSGDDGMDSEPDQLGLFGS